MHFEIQKHPNHNGPMHDFGFHLIEAINYQSWYWNEVGHTYEIIEKPGATGIPIGGLSFVDESIRIINPEFKAKPINVPVDLYKYASHMIGLLDKRKINVQLKISSELFIKSMTRYKGFTGIVNKSSDIPDEHFQVSEVIEFGSEHRVFVWQDRIEGFRCYSGDEWILPNKDILEEMIEKYRSSAPRAYTLDVGVTEDGKTVIIEVHPFVSCGLYGFYDYRILPQMMIAGFRFYSGSVV